MARSEKSSPSQPAASPTQSSRQRPASLHVQLALTNQASTMAFERIAGIHPRRWQIIDFLAHHVATTQKMLAEAISLDTGALTRLLKQLESEGWVSRQINQADNRLTDVELTAEGRRQHAEIGKKREIFVTQAMKGIDERKAAPVIKVLRQIEVNLAYLTTKG